MQTYKYKIYFSAVLSAELSLTFCSSDTRKFFNINKIIRIEIIWCHPSTNTNIKESKSFHFFFFFLLFLSLIIFNSIPFKTFAARRSHIAYTWSQTKYSLIEKVLVIATFRIR